MLDAEYRSTVEDETDLRVDYGLTGMGSYAEDGAMSPGCLFEMIVEWVQSWRPAHRSISNPYKSHQFTS